MSRPNLIALAVALALASAHAQQEGDDVPRALPVTGGVEEVPKATAVIPDETPAAETAEDSESGETPPRALPVPRAEAVDGDEVPKAIAVAPGSPQGGDTADGAADLKAWHGAIEPEGPPAEAKPDFEPPPLPLVDRPEEGVLPEPTTPIGAAWETRTEARTLTLKVPAPRGQITDRNGRPLAQNKVGYFLALKTPHLENATEDEIIRYANTRIRSAGRYLGREWSLSDEAILKHYSNRRWLPLPFSSLLTPGQKEAMGERLQAGMELFPTYQRYYPQEETACHIVGYVGKKAKVPTGPVVSGEPLWAITEGREGIEVTFDQHLQGRPGRVNFLFDADGVKLAEEMVTRPVPGNNVVTALDLEMQELAEEILGRHAKRGAFVIMDVQTGDVYAMASRPTYDLNTWIPAISTEQFKALQEDPDLPLFPRAFRGQYPPASTFKVSVALAALEAGVVDGNTWINCPTSIRIGNEVYRNWNKSGEGSLNVVGAIRRSCNTWFYEVGMRTGGDSMASMAHRLGFGTVTGIPLNAEEDGFMPNEVNHTERFGVGFSHGYLAHAAIGQGSVLATPLQVAQMMAGIGNGYAVPKPRLVLQVQDLNNNIIEAFEPVERNALNLTPANLGYVRQGMVDVVQSGSGTAKAARNSYVTMAGKTGTGEWVQDGEKLYLSWFAGFVPAEDPQYAFAAVCEGDPGQYITGGKKAAPMVGEFFNTHYKRKKERGEMGTYARTATASAATVASAGTESAPEATPVNEGQPEAGRGERRRGIFGFGRRRR